MNYFKQEKISEHITRIQDPTGVAMYLVTGDKAACLLDTGYGYRGLKEYAEKLSAQPVFVLLTHGHLDHAFGIFEFDEVYINPADREVLKAHGNPDYRFPFIESHFSDIHREDLQAVKEKELKDVLDGDCFDLGRISIEAFHVPGHTKGTMMYLIPEERTILFGDGCGPGTILLEPFSATVKEYLEGLKRIKKIENRYDRILRNHGSCESSKELLDNVMGICEEILMGTDDRQPMPQEMKDLYGYDDSCPMYCAKKIIVEEYQTRRMDGKEGNVSYREDKIS